MIVDHEILKGTFRLQDMIFVTDNLQFERTCSICGRVFLSKFLFAIHPNFRDSKQTQVVSDDSHPKWFTGNVCQFCAKIRGSGACQKNHVTVHKAKLEDHTRCPLVLYIEKRADVKWFLWVTYGHTGTCVWIRVYVSACVGLLLKCQTFF